MQPFLVKVDAPGGDKQLLLEASGAKVRSESTLHHDFEEEAVIKASATGSSATGSATGAPLCVRLALGFAATVCSLSPLALASYSRYILPAAVADAMSKAAVASSAMLLMSFAAYGIKVPPRFLAAFQHLSAGLLISSVAVELVPTIMGAPRDLMNSLAIIFGFVGGTTSFFALGAFCGAPDDDGSEASSPPASARTPRGLTKIAYAQQAERQTAPAYPAALVAAVVVDAAVDGFLIGLASGATTEVANAGVVLAVALAIEMGFTGLVYAATLRKQPAVIGLISVVAPPLVLLAVAGCGAAAAAALVAFPVAHVAVVSFGATALLYLVVVELLREAHAEMGDDTMWIEMMFFVGFFLALLLERAMTD